MRYAFEIPGRLPGLNEIIGACRSNRFAGASQKKNADRQCAEWILVGGVPVFSGRVRVHFEWFLADRRDPDNVRTGAKFILDALVETGRLPDDGPKIIAGLSDEFHLDKEAPRVRVTIETQ